MSRQVVSLANVQLVRLNPVFAAIRPGYTQRVEVVYTRGKSDPLWVGVDKGALGCTRDTTVRHNVKFLNAVIVVDLEKNVPAPRTDSFGPGRSLVIHPAVKEIRLQVMATVVHELLHVVQRWVWDEQWCAMYSQANTKGYRNNRYEQAAERSGIAWVNKNTANLSAGAFDFLIPMDTLKLLAAKK